MASGRSVLASTPPTFKGVAFKSRSVWSCDIENTQTVLPKPTFGVILLVDRALVGGREDEHLAVIGVDRLRLGQLHIGEPRD